MTQLGISLHTSLSVSLLRYSVESFWRTLALALLQMDIGHGPDKNQGTCST